MIIRQAIHDDIETLALFNMKMAFETEAVRLKPEVITAGVTGIIDNPQRGFYLVAEENDDYSASYP